MKRVTELQAASNKSEFGKWYGRFGYRLFKRVTELQAASNKSEFGKWYGRFGYRL